MKSIERMLANIKALLFRAVLSDKANYLSQMPNEIIEQIFDKVDISGLLALRKVNKKSRHMATDILFKKDNRFAGHLINELSLPMRKVDTSLTDQQVLRWLQNCSIKTHQQFRGLAVIEKLNGLNSESYLALLELYTLEQDSHYNQYFKRKLKCLLPFIQQKELVDILYDLANLEGTCFYYYPSSIFPALIQRLTINQIDNLATKLQLQLFERDDKAYTALKLLAKLAPRISPDGVKSVYHSLINLLHRLPQWDGQKTHIFEFINHRFDLIQYYLDGDFDFIVDSAINHIYGTDGGGYETAVILLAKIKNSLSVTKLNSIFEIACKKIMTRYEREAALILTTLLDNFNTNQINTINQLVIQLEKENSCNYLNGRGNNELSILKYRLLEKFDSEQLSKIGNDKLYEKTLIIAAMVPDLSSQQLLLFLHTNCKFPQETWIRELYQALGVSKNLGYVMNLNFFNTKLDAIKQLLPIIVNTLTDHQIDSLFSYLKNSLDSYYQTRAFQGPRDEEAKVLIDILLPRLGKQAIDYLCDYYSNQRVTDTKTNYGYSSVLKILKLLANYLSSEQIDKILNRLSAKIYTYDNYTISDNAYMNYECKTAGESLIIHLLLNSKISAEQLERKFTSTFIERFPLLRSVVRIMGEINLSKSASALESGNSFFQLAKAPSPHQKKLILNNDEFKKRYC